MKPEIRALISSLYSGNIDKDEFIQKYFDSNIPSEKYILNLLQDGITSTNDGIIEEAIVLLYTGVFSCSSCVQELCQLLKMPWHTKHEDITELLKKAADPSSVECLYNATEQQFQYLDYDDTFQFGRKCIKALSAIGDKNAINKLKILSNSKIDKIAEYAKKELHYKEIL